MPNLFVASPLPRSNAPLGRFTAEADFGASILGILFLQEF